MANKTVFLCEKPDQGTAWAIALGFSDRNKTKGYLEKGDQIITWAIGHLLKLAEPADYDEKYKIYSLDSLPIEPKNFKYKLSEAKQDEYKAKQFRNIQKIFKENNVEEVVIASDFDREGERIVRSILDVLKYQGNLTRVKYSQLDAGTLKKAYENRMPGSKTLNMDKAGQARTIADWLIGMNFSRAMTQANKGMVSSPLNVGRVITPTVYIVYLRCKEIANFIPKDYFELSAVFGDSSLSKSITTNWVIPKEHLDEIENKCINKSVVEEVVKKVKGKQGKVTSYDKTRKKQNAPLPFSILKLQVKAYAQYGYKPDVVLATAQSLYEKHRATSYPRTDCEYIPEEQFGEASQVLATLLKTDPNNSELRDLVGKVNTKQKSVAWNSKKVAESAHHGIIPTLEVANINSMSDEERNVYDLVRRHYIAQFLPLYEYDSTSIIIECENESFKTTGSVPAIPGWKIAFSNFKADDGEDESKMLPALKNGQILNCENAQLESKKTKPPAYFTSVSIIEEMEAAAKYIQDPALKKVLKNTKGLGTGATQANIVKNALRYEYIAENKNKIIITPTGEKLIEFIPEMLRSIETSAYWESVLEDISNGEHSFEDFITEIKKNISDLIIEFKAGKFRFDAPVGMAYTCKKCEGGLKRIKSLKTGKNFWICLNRDNCGSLYNDSRGKPGEIIEKAADVEQGSQEHFDPKTGEKLIRRKGQFGFYWKNETTGVNYKDDEDKIAPIFGEDIDQGKEVYKDPIDGEKLIRKKGEKGMYWMNVTAKRFYSDDAENIKPIFPDIIDQGKIEYFDPLDKKTKLVRKSGKFGFYWQNPKNNKNYKESSPMIPDLPKIDASLKCKKCNKGFLGERKGKKGVFWGCSNYPTCSNIVNDNHGKPEGY